MKRTLLAALALGLCAACYDPNLRSGAPVQVVGAFSSGGGLMHSRSYSMVGWIGSSKLSWIAQSPTHRTLDGVSLQTKGR